MVAPNFKKATNTVIDPTNVKYGAPDIVYFANVLDGVHATDRIQVQNIERVTNPWTYHIYQEGGITYARRGDTSSPQYTDSSNPCLVINSALSAAYTEFSKAVLLLAPQTFTFPTGAATSGSNIALIDIAGKSNVSIIGAGMDKTVIVNGKIHKQAVPTTSNVVVSDITVNANSQFGNACHIGQNSIDFRLIRSKFMNSGGSFCLNWSRVDRLIAFQCQFLEGGLTTAADNAAGGQAKFLEDDTTPTEKETQFIQCYFEKTNSLGGGMLTTGGTGNLLVQNCQFVNKGDVNTSYNGVSVENTHLGGTDTSCKSVRVIGCLGIGQNMGVSIGNSSGVDPVRSGLILGCNMQGGQRIYDAKDALIANGITWNTGGPGFAMSRNSLAKLHNCIARNTNITLAGSNFNAGGFYGEQNAYLEIDHLTVIDDADSTRSVNPSVNTTSHGIRVSQTTVGTGVVEIHNCNLIGPFNPNGTGALEALRIGNSDFVVVRGGRLPVSPNNLTNFTSDNNIDIRGLKNYNPLGAASITVPGTGPFTYTNNDGVCETVHINGGTVSNVTLGGVSLFTATNRSVWLEPGQSIVVTYSSAPTMVKDRK